MFRELSLKSRLEINCWQKRRKLIITDYQFYTTKFMKSMNKLFNLAIILLLLVFSIGCSDDNQLDVILGADKSELSFLAKDEPQMVTLSCNTDWLQKVIKVGVRLVLPVGTEKVC